MGDLVAGLSRESDGLPRVSAKGASLPRPHSMPQALALASSLSPVALLYLQRIAGNQAVVRTLQREAGNPDQDGAISDIGAFVNEWRYLAGEGVVGFATDELEAALHKKPGDKKGWFVGLLTNLMLAATVLTPEGWALAAVEQGQLLAQIGLTVAGSMANQPDDEEDPDRPIGQTRKAMLAALDQQKILFDDATPGWVAPLSGQQATRGAIVDQVMTKFFQPPMLRQGPGGRTRINPTPVRNAYQALATDYYERFKLQVQPIGKEVWGKKKYVVVRLGGRPTERRLGVTYPGWGGMHVLVKRKGDVRHRGATEFFVNEYEYARTLDEDMVGAAIAQLEAADETLTVVDPSAVDGLPEIPMVPPSSASQGGWIDMGRGPYGS